MQRIIVDITPGFRMPTIYFSQGDVGTQFEIDLRSRFGNTLPASPTVTIQATKPSGFGFSVAATSVTNGVAVFTTTAEMTDEAGRFPAELKVVKDSVSLFSANFYMSGEATTHPEGTIDGQQETVIPELTQLVDRAEEAASSVLDRQTVTTTLAAGSQATYEYDEDTNTQTFGIPQGEAGAGAAGVTASAYSSSSTYAVGDYVIHNSNLYRCTTAITTAESFTAAHWTQVVLGDDVSDLKSEINTLENGGQNFSDGYGITINGTVVATEGVCLSDFIPVEGSTGYVTVSSAHTPSPRSNLNIIEYTADKAFVDYWGANPTKSFTTNAATRYIRFSFDDGFEATVTKYATSEIIYKATQTESLNERIDSRAETVVQATDWDNVIPSSRHDPNTNYIDPEKVTSGYINANGVYTPYETLQCTDYIPLEAGKTYYKGIGVYGGTYYGYYDEDYNVVASGSTLGELASPFVVPNNAKFGRFTLGNNAVGDDIVWIFTQNGTPEHYRTEYYFGEKMNDAVRTAVEDDVNPTEYKGMDIQTFDTCVCIGDSLTEGIFNYNNGGTTGYASIPEVSYPAALERITGINVANLGVSGYTSLEWYTANQSADLSDHKFAIIQFGVNDVIEYGGWTQNSIDGYTGIINKLKADNPNIKIFISTVMPAISYPASNYTAFNTALKAFVENLEDADVILLDMATYGNTAPAQYNAGHLSAYGYWRLAKDYANYISWYMHNNGMQFQEIQFIGTDKHYT